MTPMSHPPYSSNLTLSDFFLFPQMKKDLKGKHFANVEEVGKKMTEALEGIKIDECRNCSEQWKNILRGVLHQMESTLTGTEV